MGVDTIGLVVANPHDHVEITVGADVAEGRITFITTKISGPQSPPPRAVVVALESEAVANPGCDSLRLWRILSVQDSRRDGTEPQHDGRSGKHAGGAYATHFLGGSYTKHSQNKIAC